MREEHASYQRDFLLSYSVKCIWLVDRSASSLSSLSLTIFLTFRTGKISHILFTVYIFEKLIIT